MIVISPHLDDAVFSCGAALAAHPGSSVVTVFAGLPADAAMKTDWDALCGFASAGEAMQARHREDEAALAILGAAPHWLGFVDGQYGPYGESADDDDDAIATALRSTLLALADTVVALPLGLFHADHLRAHRAACLALRGLAVDAFVYEDAIYRAMPGLLDARLAALAGGTIDATPADLVPSEFAAGADDLALKARAVGCYASQAPALGAEGMADTARPERYRRLLR